MSARRRPVRVLLALLLVAGLVVGVAAVGVLGARYRLFAVTGASMQPTLNTGDRMLARKDALPVARGDVVVLGEGAWVGPRVPAADQVKRVLAVAGDSVVCCDAEGVATLGATAGDAGRSVVLVPDGRLFVLGDNPGMSTDSRAHLDVAGGTVALSDVVGRVEAVVYPLSDWGTPSGDSGPVPLVLAALGGLVLLVVGGVGGSLMDQRQPLNRPAPRRRPGPRN